MTINSLRLEVFQETDLTFFDEIKRCIDSEAYRAAYIMIWISIAESLLSKFKQMSFRDDEVGRILKELEKDEKENISIDNKLLEKAKELGYIDKDELVKLNTIRQMRNSFAHPTGKAPDKKEVFCALETAVSLVLSKQPLLRHGYVKKTIDKMFNDQHLYDDNSSIVEKHAANFVNRIHPDVLKFSLKYFLTKIDGTFEDYEMKIFRRRGIIFGLKVIETILSNNLQEKNDLNDYLDEHQISSSLLYVNKNIWEYLPPQEKNRAFGYITDEIDNEDMIFCRNYILNKLYGLYESSNLSGRQKTKFKSILNSFSYYSIISSDIPLKCYVKRIIEDLESHTWDRQNKAADAFFELEEKIRTIDNESIEKLGRNILQAAEGGSWRSRDFILSIKNKNKIYPQSFIYGIITESFVNDEGKYRLKSRYLKPVVLITLKHPNKDEIFGNLIHQIRNSTPKYVKSETHHKKSLEELKKINDDLGNDKYINALIHSIKSSKTKFFT